jgi:hypothetical protein
MALRSGSVNCAQPEVLNERIKIPVIVKQIISALDASSGDNDIYCLANGYAGCAQNAKVPGGLNRNFGSAKFNDRQRSQQRSCPVEMPLARETLQDLHQDQVTDCKELGAK